MPTSRIFVIGLFATALVGAAAAAAEPPAKQSGAPAFGN